MFAQNYARFCVVASNDSGPGLCHRINVGPIIIIRLVCSKGYARHFTYITKVRVGQFMLQ